MLRDNVLIDRIIIIITILTMLIFSDIPAIEGEGYRVFYNIHT